jgi:hypothetical protein
MKKEIEAACRRVAQGMIEALDLCQVEVSFQKINIEVITK